MRAATAVHQIAASTVSSSVLFLLTLTRARTISTAIHITSPIKQGIELLLPVHRSDSLGTSHSILRSVQHSSSRQLLSAIALDDRRPYSHFRTIHTLCTRQPNRIFKVPPFAEKKRVSLTTTSTHHTTPYHNSTSGAVRPLHISSLSANTSSSPSSSPSLLPPTPGSAGVLAAPSDPSAAPTLQINSPTEPISDSLPPIESATATASLITTATTITSDSTIAAPTGLKRHRRMSSADETKVAHRRLAASSQELNGEMKIVLSPGEQKICDLLDVVSKQLEKEKGLKVELRIAGGWVRDKLLGLDCHDLDIAIDTMMGFEFATYVNEYLVQNRGHKSHSIAKIATNPAKSKHLETATMVVYGAPLDFVNLRSEIYDDTSRIPTEITFGTPSEDAYRRDTTINALFYNIHTRSVEDFTGRGLLDLKEGLIRTPLTSFATFEQDPLRVMRCIRFAARFHFRISDDAKLAILDPRIKEALKTKISKERIGAELDKMIDDGAGRSTAIGLLQELDLYDVVFAAPTISPPGTAKSAMTTAVEGEVGDAQVAFKLVWILEWLLKMNVAPGLMDTSAKSLSSLPKTTLEHQDAGQVLLLQQTASQPEKTSFLRPLISTPVSAVVAQTAQQPVEDPLESVRIGTRNLILSGMLYPYKDMKAIVNKKSTSAIAWIFRYGLKGRNHDIDMVVRLMEFLPTVKEVVHRHWNEVKEGDETKMEHHKPQAGMLIRDIGFLAIIGQRWPCAFLLSLAVDLVPKFEQLHAGVLDTETTTTLEMYNHFLAEARRLKIEDTYGWKYIVDGSQLSMLLGIKTGPKITVLLRKVMEWQVQNHPGGSRDSCVEWIRAHPELFQ